MTKAAKAEKYLNKPELTNLLVAQAAEMAGDRRKAEETYKKLIKTRDIAVRDADGCFSILGRSKEMFISGGENVYPAEVEKAIMQHPAVEKTVVFGVPNPKWKEGIKAVCRLKAEQTLEPRELIEFVGTRIAGSANTLYALDPTDSGGTSAMATATPGSASLDSARDTP